ncbi:MAG: type II toxin-antitoxin system HicA family toxin [Butyrivibrio sp.]|nr:type II toxin-antitoxin system HicA family toxin [Butyrivibrio sp.]
MKRFIFVKLLESNGWYLKRHGGDHDIYTNGSGGRIVVPRHSELKEPLVKAEIRKWGLK